MVRIYKLEEYSKYDSMVSDFINNLDIDKLNEGSKEEQVYKKILSDLKLNYSFIGTFGMGIALFFPIVEKLISRISVEVTTESVVLATICAISIIYLEEKKMDTSKHDKIKQDSKTLLEELKLRGIGNGIIKKIIKCFKSIVNLFSVIGRNLDTVANGFIDLFSYTALLVPVLNGIQYVVGKYDLTLETLPANLMAISVGVGSLVAKNVITDIINKVKKKFRKAGKDIKIEEPIKKYGEMDYGKEVDTYDKSEIIKEWEK